MAQQSAKHVLVDKAQRTMLISISIATIVVVFCLVAFKSLWSEAGYQNKIIKMKKEASVQYKENIDAVDKLVSQYNVFNNEDTNILGGSRTGAGELDGANGRIVLDALPSKYDFPALTSSLEKILLTRKATIESITGFDDESAQSTAAQSTPTSTSTPITFTLGTSTSYAGSRDIINDLQRSIRPFVIQQLQLSGKDAEMSMTITAETYYQPTKSLGVTFKEVK